MLMKLAARPKLKPSASTAPRERDADAIHIPADAHTLSGFRAWAHAESFPEAGRITFIQGKVIVDMSQEELNTHSILKTEICRFLATINVAEGLGVVFCDGCFVVHAPPEQRRVAGYEQAFPACRGRV